MKILRLIIYIACITFFAVGCGKKTVDVDLEIMQELEALYPERNFRGSIIEEQEGSNIIIYGQEVDSDTFIGIVDVIKRTVDNHKIDLSYLNIMLVDKEFEDAFVVLTSNDLETYSIEIGRNTTDISDADLKEELDILIKKFLEELEMRKY